jgi:hypothetical protein
MRIVRLAAVACVLLLAPAASGAPSNVWYHYVVTGRTTETTDEKTERVGSPTQTTTDVRVIEWDARSRAASSVTSSGRDVSLDAALYGSVVKFTEDERYDGFYASPNPADPSNPLKKPCTRKVSGEDRAGARRSFQARLGGTARTGFSLQFRPPAPTVRVHFVRTDGCTDTPTGPTASDASVRVELLPSTELQRLRLHIPARRIAFGKTFQSGVITFRQDLPPTFGGGQTLRVSRKWEVRIYLYRCPGTKACPAKDVPKAAYKPLP